MKKSLRLTKVAELIVPWPLTPHLVFFILFTWYLTAYCKDKYREKKLKYQRKSHLALNGWKLLYHRDFSASAWRRKTPLGSHIPWFLQHTRSSSTVAARALLGWLLRNPVRWKASSFPMSTKAIPSLRHQNKDQGSHNGLEARYYQALHLLLPSTSTLHSGHRAAPCWLRTS